MGAELYYGYYSKECDNSNVIPYLNILGANTNYTQIDFETIIDKYREE